jgi:hypothetical protein
MPVLYFPCSIHRLARNSRSTRRAFPARALADWLASRPYASIFGIRAIKLELLAREWHCAGGTGVSLEAAQSGEATRALAGAGTASLPATGGSADA